MRRGLKLNSSNLRQRTAEPLCPLELSVTPVRVDNGDDLERQKRARDKATDHRSRDSLHDVGTAACGPKKRYESDEHRRHRHELRSDTKHGAFRVRMDDVIEVADLAGAQTANERVIDVDDH